ncbi:MAG TPA: Hsp20/alpha crystallin family protein [Candidatus Acidoferrales bacterium]|jgi:HSP20 family protein|nr:Hsp20/alpha crystallin family protein [Candidatus Acidoferrales bacterium]
MANLVRSKDVFDALFDFRRDFDGIFNRFLAGAASPGSRTPAPLATVPPIEVRIDNTDKKYHVRMALPGVDPKEVQISLQGDALTVSGEHRSEEEKKGSDYVHREFSYEQFQRVIPLPEGLDTEKISAEFNNGVLEIAVPFSATALPKQIEIKSAKNAEDAENAKTKIANA